MPQFDPACFDAFSRLLAQPDPGDLPRRGHVLRCEGDPNRRATRLPSVLMGWLQQRWVKELDGEEWLSWATHTTQQSAPPQDAAPAGFFRLAAGALVPDDLMAMSQVRER